MELGDKKEVPPPPLSGALDWEPPPFPFTELYSGDPPLLGYPDGL